MSTNRLERLDRAPILRSIFIMSLPVILGNLAMVIYNLTDAYFIGQLQDVEQLAAATFAYPLMMIISSIGAIFSIGGASYLSRSLGANRKDLAEKTLIKALVSSLFVGAAVAIISMIFLSEIIELLGAVGETYDYTRDYVFFLLLATPIIMINVVSIDTLRAEGAAKLAMIGMMVGVTTNIILDPIMIFALGLGVKGAAIATVAGNIAAFIVNMYFFRYKTHLKVKIRQAFSKNGMLFEIVKIGFPAALNIILMSVAMVITNSIASNYGDAVVAGMGLALRNHSIVIQILLGFSMGTQPLIGYNYGKKDYMKVKKLIYTNMSVISAFGTVLSVTFFILAEPLISVFNSDPEVIFNGARGLRALLFMKPLISIFMVSMSAVQAMGKGLIALIFSITRQLILFMIIINLLNHYYGYNGFIYAQAISDFIIIILSGFIISAVLHKLTKETPLTSSFKIIKE